MAAAQNTCPLTLITCSSVDLHSTDSVTSETAPSVPTVTTFTGTATVRPVRMAVLRISESWKGKEKDTYLLLGASCAATVSCD